MRAAPTTFLRLHQVDLLWEVKVAGKNEPEFALIQPTASTPGAIINFHAVILHNDQGMITVRASHSVSKGRHENSMNAESTGRQGKGSRGVCGRGFANRFDGRRKDVEDVAFQTQGQGGMGVMICGSTVDHNIRHPPFRRDQRNTGRRFD